MFLATIGLEVCMHTLLSRLPRPLIWFPVVVVTLVWLLTPLRALALEVTPAELDFTADAGAWSTATLNLVNNESQPQDYRIYASDDYQDWFTISPEEISLAPNQSAEIKITVSPPSSTRGEHTAFVYITSTQPSSGLQVALGVKVRANITVSRSEPGWKIFRDNPLLLVAVIGGLAGLIVGVVVWRRRRRYDYREFR